MIGISGYEKKWVGVAVSGPESARDKLRLENEQEFEHDVLEQGWGGWAPKRACCPAEEQGRCSWQITLCLDVVVLLGRWRGWEESYQHGVDKWDVIISHMGSSLQSVQAWDISAEGKHLWQR